MTDSKGHSVKRWLPLESNPDVLNDFVSRIGLDVSKHSFCDVFGLDEELLAMVPQPVIAVIMCYPITKDSEDAAKAEDAELLASGLATSGNDVYYMKQTIGNACGTIALLHAIGNNLEHLPPADGSFLQQFYDATQSLSPEERGTYLQDPPKGAPNIETAHQAAAAEGNTAPPSEDEDVDLHFVAFVHRNGALWQLDGRRKGPVKHGPTSESTLLTDTVKVVRQFIDRSNSINFNLLALTATSTD